MTNGTRRRPASAPARAARAASAQDAEIARQLLKHWHEAVPDDRMAHLVKDASRSFLRALQARLARHGVPLGHWTYLRILWQRDGLTQRELSAEAGVMEPTTVIALRAMERAGYVTRERRDGNRKNLYVRLTPLGKRLKRRLVPLAEDVNAVAAHGIAAGDLAIARRCLLAMIDNLAQDSLAASASASRAAG